MVIKKHKWKHNAMEIIDEIEKFPLSGSRLKNRFLQRMIDKETLYKCCLIQV
jgi:hypothetical protein